MKDIFLVLGSNSFTGSHFVNHLINKGHKVNQLTKLQNSYGPISAIVKNNENWIALHDIRVDTSSSIIE